MNSSQVIHTIHPQGLATGSLAYPIYPCFPSAVGSLSILLLFTVSPLHLFILIVLIRQYDLPQRHKFFLSLTMYDNLQIIANGVFGLIGLVFALRTDSLTCQVLRQICEFMLTSTFVGAGLSIAALATERYINCFYCMRAYHIISKKRVKAVIISIASLSFVAGCIVLHPNTANPHPRVLRNTAIPTLTINLTTLLSSLTVTIFQCRLYLLSREKLKVDASKPKFGRAAEAADLRRQQIKVTFTSSLIVVSYLLCMIPANFYNLYVFISGKEDNFTNTWKAFTVLALLNTLFDPLVYGIGMSDTRKLLLAALRKHKAAFLKMFAKNESLACTSSSAEAQTDE